MKSLRIVFMGSPEFAVPSLEALAHSSYDIISVVTGLDKKRGRGGALSPTPVKAKALELGLQVKEFDSTRTPDFQEYLESLKPDLLVVVAFKILPPAVLKIPERGSVNLHASLLPKYRGAAPIHWAVINGEKTTGNTVFMLNERIDAGAVIARQEVEIGPDDTTGDVYVTLMKAGASLLVGAVDAIAGNAAVLLPQQEGEATPAPKVYAEMAQIRFGEDCYSVHNRIRGFSPSPGAWVMIGDERVKLVGSSVEPDIKLEPGAASLMDGKFLIGCKTGSVGLKTIQFPGKAKVEAAAWLAASGKQIRFDV